MVECRGNWEIGDLDQRDHPEADGTSYTVSMLRATGQDQSFSQSGFFTNNKNVCSVSRIRIYNNTKLSTSFKQP